MKPAITTKDKAIHSFDVLHSGWEFDAKGWIFKEENGKLKAILTKHEQPYVASREELIKLLDRYETAISETRKALRLLGS